MDIRVYADRFSRGTSVDAFTEDVMAVKIERGLRGRDLVAEPAKATITLLSGAKFPLGYDLWSLQRGSDIRIAEYGSRNLFTGKLWRCYRDQVYPDRLYVECFGVTRWLYDRPVELPIQLNQTADELITSALAGAIVPRGDYDPVSEYPWAVVDDTSQLYYFDGTAKITINAATAESKGLSGDTGAFIVKLTPDAAAWTNAAINVATGLAGTSSDGIVIRISSAGLLQFYFRSTGVSDTIQVASYAPTVRSGWACSWGGGYFQASVDGVTEDTIAITNPWRALDGLCIGADGDGAYGWLGMVHDYVLALGVKPTEANLNWLADPDNVICAEELDARLGVGKWLWYRPAQKSSDDLSAYGVAASWTNSSTVYGVGRCVVYGNALDLDFESGVAEFPYSSDSPGLLGDLIEQCCQGEFGYFYEDGDGALVFANRQHYYNVGTYHVYTSCRKVWSDYALDVVNRVRLRSQVRTLSTGATVWTNTNEIEIAPGHSTLTVGYEDSNGEVIGVAGGVDAYSFVFRSWPDGGGAVVKQSFGLDDLGTKARLTVNNGRGTPIYLQAGARLVGDALLRDPVMEVIRQDKSNIREVGANELVMNIPLVESANELDNLARMMLRRYGGLQDYFAWVEFDAKVHSLAFTDRDLGDGLLLQLGVPFTDDLYILIGDEVEIDLAGQSGRFRWYVRPDDNTAWAKVGTSKVGTGIIAF